tara:strand:- start:275 stop:388 length:114 start_codon:yes stop_codon:yes gene_type:complete
MQFLPDAITDELKTSRRELLELGNCIAPTIHRRGENV